MENDQSLYLDLMKKCLVNWNYGSKETILVKPKKKWKRMIIKMLNARSLQAVRSFPMDPYRREYGRDGCNWVPVAHTMIGLKRLDNIQYCVEDVIRNRVPGDLIETGVWRGGATIFMRAILKAHGITDRKVWVADSFAGSPKSDAKKYPKDTDDTHHTRVELTIPLNEVKANFESYGLLDDQVQFLKGWFKDTLPTAPINQLAVLRLDGDMYESTIDPLKNLYSKLSKGGYLIVDDYGAVPGCKAAIDDFRRGNGIKDIINTIDRAGVYWQKST
jgi:O-methyltransferase